MSFGEQVITLGCDAGGTTIEAGAVRGGQVLARVAIPTRSEEGLRQRLPAIRDALD